MVKKFEVQLDNRGKEDLSAVREGEVVRFRHVQGDSTDPRLIAVIDIDEQPVGYIPASHWIVGSMHDDGQGYDAVVKRTEQDGVVTIEATERGIPATGPIDESPTQQKRGALFWVLLAIGGFAVLVILAMAFGPTPEERAEMAEQRAEERKVADLADAAAAEAEAEAERLALKGAVDGWRSQVLGAVLGCDVSAQAMANSLTAIGEGRGSTFDGFRAGENVEDACFASWRALGEIDLPDVAGEDENLLENATEACEFAMLARQNAGEAAQELFDGPIRNSNMAALTDAISDSTAQGARCAAGLASVGVRFDLDALEGS